jgi:hypothetical protein
MAKNIKKTSKSKVKPLVEEAVPRRPNNVVFRTNMDASVAIMRLDEDQYFYSLDGIAAELWKLIDGKASLKDIMKKLERRFQPPSGRFERDVKGLLGQLQKQKLLEYRDS